MGSCLKKIRRENTKNAVYCEKCYFCRRKPYKILYYELQDY